MRPFCLFCLVLLLCFNLRAQDDPASMHPSQQPAGVYAFKGGLTMATQRWNGTDRQALPSYHGVLSFESAGDWRERNGRFSRTNFGLNVGYHRKGSAVRMQYQNPLDLSQIIRHRIDIPFHHLALTPYAKGQFWSNPKTMSYYALGAHLSYTVAHDTSMFFVDKRYVNKFNYGLWIAGGVEFSLGADSSFGLVLELSITPEISRQIFIPPGLPIQFRDASGSVQTFVSQEQRVNNLIFELSVGFKFVRPKYEYLED